MGCGINREGAFVQTWESNRSVRIENVGATDVVGTWPEVKKLEQYCRRRKLPFSLIYWASGYPALAKRGLADDSTWYVSVMRQGYDYAMVQGSPDHYVVQSWLDAPSHSTPETAPFTFTRSVLDFARRFARRSQP